MTCGMRNAECRNGGADEAALVLRWEGVGGVFDHGQVVPCCKRIDRIHFGGQAGDVDGDDGAGALGDGSLDQVRAQVQAAVIDVHQHGFGVEVADDLGGGGEGVGGRDDLIALTQAGGFERQVHRRGAGVDGYGMFGADGRSELSLELAGLGAGGDPARVERLFDLDQFLIVDVG